MGARVDIRVDPSIIESGIHITGVLEIHMSFFVTNAGINATAANMAGGVVVRRVTEGDQG